MSQVIGKVSSKKIQDLLLHVGFSRSLNLALKMSDSKKEQADASEQMHANPDIGSVSPQQATDMDLGPCERIMSERGTDYRISLLENKFKSAISSWRKQSNRILNMITDSNNTVVIRNNRDSLQNKLDEMSEVLETLQQIKEDCSTEANLFENIEADHQIIITRVSERISELDSQRQEVSPNKSLRSARSTSSKDSNASKFSDAVARKAVLQAKFKYIEMESKCKAELKKIQMMKELDMVGAEIYVLGPGEGYFEAPEADSKAHIPFVKDESADYVKEYVESFNHPTCPIEVNVVVSDGNNPSVLNLNSQSGTASTINSIVSTTNVVPTSSESQSSAIGLNPSVPDFTPSAHSQAFTQSSWVYITVLPATSHTIKPPFPSNEKIHSTLASSSTNATSLGHTAVQGSAVVSSITSFVPSSTLSSSLNKTEQGLIELAKMLADQVSLSRLPSPEPSIFSVDPLSYPGWKSSFKILIEQRQIPPSERIHYLKRYVSGPVRDVIEGFFLLPSDMAYEEAKKTLDKRYGDPFVISNTFRDKLDKWPKIPPRDGTGLRKFSDFLQQCQIAMQTISSLHVLNDDRENRKLLTKLPDWMVSRWGRVVSRWKEERSQFPPYKEFVEFVTKEATIACDPVTSLQSLKEVSDGQKSHRMPSRQDKGSYGSRTFFQEVQEKDKKSHEMTRVLCALCNKPHELDDCRAFLNKPLVDRKSFVNEKGLCFACLQGGHISRKCKHRKKCKTCSKFHPSSLHGDKRTPSKQGERNDSSQGKSDEETAVKITHTGAISLSNSEKCRKCSMIVPVYVSHCDFPEKERLIYALLDTQSDTTFTLEETCNALGVSGIDVKLSLSTMYAANKVVTSTKVRGLVVRGINDGPRISLPNAYTRSIMPVNHNHIPTSDIARMWPHLEEIADHIEPLRDCEIGLLIGYNCPRALAPRKVVSSSKDGPYGLRTDLGWSIVGIVDTEACEEDPIGLSHRILSQEVKSPLIQDADTNHFSVMFSVKTKVKEIDSGDVLKVMERDFSDFGVGDTKYSQEDKKFVSVLSQSIHFENGHYEMPLPFRGKDPRLPNNRAYALNRLKHISSPC